MNREELREYVKQLPQEEVLQELLIAQIECNTKAEHLKKGVSILKRFLFAAQVFAALWILDKVLLLFFS